MGPGTDIHGIAVNVRLLDDFEVADWPVRVLDGKHLWQAGCKRPSTAITRRFLALATNGGAPATLFPVII